MKRLIAAGLVSGVLVLISGCSNSGYGTTTGKADVTSFNGNPGTPSCSNPPRPANTAVYCLAAGLLPYPFDAYFAGSTDGTLNIPPNQLWPAVPALNAIDGFSTTAPIRERFNGKIDAASLATPGAVIVVHINTTNAPTATVPAKAPVPPPVGKFIPLAGCVPGPMCTAANYDYMVAPAADDPTILEITPLKPLAASTCLPPPPNSPCAGGGLGEAYMVLLTKAITVGGVPAVPDADYASFQTALASGGQTCPSITDPNLNALCQLSGAHLGLAHALLGVNPANVVASFSFSTQSTLDTLFYAAGEAIATPHVINVNQAFTAPSVPMTTKTFGGVGLADVYVGVMTLTYYLATPAASPTAPDTEYWQAAAAKAPDGISTFTTRFNPVPVPTVQALQVPVLMTVPNAAGTAASGQPQPKSGWPIVIFQHGLEADRTNLILIADRLALGGLVGIAIDMPLHGCTPPFTTSPFCAALYAASTNPLYTGLGLPATGSIERTFDLTTLSGGKAIDPSGSHYVALGSPLTLRDNFRQSSVDLVTLAASVGTITLPAPATAPYIDAANVHFMGHSQGSIVGPGFLAAISLLPVPPVLSVTLANPGGKWVYLGVESPTFGPPAIAQLEKASNGLLTLGTTPFAQYERDVQTVLDSGDPWNYIATASATHPIHLIQVIGSTPTNPPDCNANSPPPMWCTDQVVPNDATARIIATGDFTQAHFPGVAGADLHPFVNFTAGVHASFVDPRADGAVTQEMQLEAVSFTGQAIPAAGVLTPTTPGSSLVIFNPAVVQ
jgi:hypothetical protein